jgi:nickel-dependent lactate racemase
MKLNLAYGKTGLTVDLPEEWQVTVIEPRRVSGLPDPEAALRQALQSPIGASPLRDTVQPGHKVGIVFSDITRPSPSHLLVPAILEQLTAVPPEQITLFNALGTHRPNTEAELRSILGDPIVEKHRIVQNNAFDRTTQMLVGRCKRGHEVWLNREFMECDVKILTGFIEPHFFAGFSGGYKAIMPGMAGQWTVLRNHDAIMVGEPMATWGVTHGNPMYEEIREIGMMAQPHFLLNVTLNNDKKITGVFAGDVDQAHAAGCDFARQMVMVPVAEEFDIVITTNSGYPLDLNLYQSVKGMSAAAQIVRDGGAIVIAADCWDGIPDHGLYGELLRGASDPHSLLETVSQADFLQQDQWQAQAQAQIQLKADVYVHTHNLNETTIREALLLPSSHIETTVRELLEEMGPEARICVLPEGPQTIPYIQSQEVVP